ncbi:MAG: homoserine kinase [Gemmatimonadaceae bacterium]
MTMAPPGRVCASTPGSIGNLGPGLDVLGCAIEGARDEVIAEWTDEPGVIVLDSGHPDLPRSASRHTSAIAAAAVFHQAQQHGATARAAGIALTVRKGLPLSGGQGGSAASAVAGAAAANALFGGVLDTASLLDCCLVAEAKVAGRHLDNIAPALMGGIVLIRCIDPIDVLRLPIPKGLWLVLAHPAQRLSTAMARRALPRSVPLPIVTHQLAQVGAMVAACYADDLRLFGRAVDDRIAEPARAPLIPGFLGAKRAAMEAGALGMSISGAGPTAFAVADDEARAQQVAAAMRESYARQDIVCTTTVTVIDANGTTVSPLPA